MGFHALHPHLRPSVNRLTGNAKPEGNTTMLGQGKDMNVFWANSRFPALNRCARPDVPTGR